MFANVWTSPTLVVSPVYTTYLPSLSDHVTCLRNFVSLQVQQTQPQLQPLRHHLHQLEHHNQLQRQAHPSLVTGLMKRRLVNERQKSNAVGHGKQGSKNSAIGCENLKWDSSVMCQDEANELMQGTDGDHKTYSQHCHVCGKTLTGLQQIRQHFEGKHHLKRLRRHVSYFKLDNDAHTVSGTEHSNVTEDDLVVI